MSELRRERVTLSWLDAILIYETKENEQTTFKVQFSSPYGGDFVELPITNNQSVSLRSIHSSAKFNAKDKHETHFTLYGWTITVKASFGDFYVSGKGPDKGDVLPNQIVTDPAKLEACIRECREEVERRHDQLYKNKQLVKDIQQKFYDEEDAAIASQKK